jgi:hypothetical protein
MALKDAHSQNPKWHGGDGFLSSAKHSHYVICVACFGRFYGFVSGAQHIASALRWFHIVDSGLLIGLKTLWELGEGSPHLEAIRGLSYLQIHARTRLTEADGRGNPTVMV